MEPAADPPEPIRNLADLVRRAARRDAEHTALLYGDERMSWGELDQGVDRAAGALRALGLDPGDRVALCLGNTPTFPVAYFGALRAGLVAVPVNTGYTDAETHHLLADSGAAVLMIDTGADTGPGAGTEAGTVHAGGPPREGLPALRHVVPAYGTGDGTFDRLLAAASGEPVRPAAGGEDLAVLSYTSGTSGRPKGAMLSHRALVANLDQCARMTQPAPITPADVVLLALPLFHIYGLNLGLGMVAWAGATALVVPRFDAAEALRLMDHHRVTNVPGAPQMYVEWADVPVDAVRAGFASVRLALSGAAPLPTAVSERMAERGVSVYEGYGLTEAPAVTCTAGTGGPRKPGSVGRPLPAVEVQLRDSQGDPVEDGDPGAVVVRGANLFSGYWPDGHDGPDADGWFDTGDVAYADGDGDLHLTDPRTELVLVSGFNVYPAEVEHVLAEHPDIAETAVIGVPDDRTGETVRAYVVARPGAALREEDVVTHCRRSLARFKCPGEVRFVVALPRTATGKVRKAALRAEALREGDSGAAGGGER